MVAIGKQLLSDGFDVTISLAEPYADVASSAGLRPISLLTTEEFDKTLANANVWRPITGARTVLGWVVENFMRQHFDVIQSQHQPGKTVLVSHPLDLGSRVFREVDSQTPLVDIHLAPAILRVPSSPAKLTPWKLEVRRPAWAVRGMYWVADHFGVDPVVKSKLNAFRREHGLEPVSRILKDYWLSPDRIVAMYPQWFAPETSMYSPRLVHAGFPLQDFGDNTLAESIDSRPFVFTAGTANHHCREFFEIAAKACQRIQHPGILLSTHRDNFPDDLPSCVQTAEFIPLGQLLPKCAAIVHHGGVGTTSQALASGTPQVIRPMAFDQFDHAERIQRLGVGCWLKNDKRLESALRSCLEPAVVDKCKQVADRFGKSAIETAASEIRSALQI